jgi:E3 ubiquitin-protein ligase HUWE1
MLDLQWSTSLSLPSRINLITSLKVYLLPLPPTPMHYSEHNANMDITGFHDIIPADIISIFTEQELELLISGLPDIDVDDWKNNTEYSGYTASSPQIVWFWRMVRSFDKEQRAKLLQFVTGTSKVPLNGFKELEGMNGFSRFSIHRDYTSDRLPSAHTCFNQLDLPEYESYEKLRDTLLLAITDGSGEFGFA